MRQKNYLKKLCMLLLAFVCISAVAQNDNALHFDGTNDYIILDHFELPNDSDPNNNEFTLELWIKPELPNANKVNIVSFSGATGNNFSYEFTLEQGSLIYAEWDDEAPYAGFKVGDGIIENDSWHHAAFVRKGYSENDEPNVFIYIDGLLVGSGKVSDTSDFVTDFFTIGAYKFKNGVEGDGYQQYFPGSMDELRIWGYAKTQSEIRGQMVSKLDGTEENFDKLLAYYPFDEGIAGEDNTSITEVEDASGNNHNGQLVNFALTDEVSNFVAEEDYTSVEKGTFITTWEVPDDGLEIAIPTDSGYTYNYTVDWGDGNKTTETGNAKHTYQSADTYTVTISGDFPAIYFNNTDRVLFDNDTYAVENILEKIRTVEQWGYIEWKSMANAFYSCTNLDVVASDTPNLSDVLVMWGAFRISGVTGQNTDFNSWDVSNVAAFSLMFEQSNFDANIGSWDFSSMNVAQSANIFGREDGTALADLAPMSCFNTSLTLAGWANNANTPSGVSESDRFHMAVPDYFDFDIITGSVTELNDKLWTIEKIHGDTCDADDIESEYFITTWKVDTPTGLDITIPINDGFNYNYFVDWGDGSALEYFTGEAYHEYNAAGTYDVKILGEFPAIQFNNEGGDNEDGVLVRVNKDKIKEVQQWGAIEWQSMNGAFWGCINLDVTAMDIPNLENVTNMFAMFNRLKIFKGENINLEQWDVSNVTNMSHMFWNSDAFNKDISSWDVSNVINMERMFYAADAFNQNLGSWNLESVEDINEMFGGSSGMDCSNYTDTLTGWGNNEDTASGSGDEFTIIGVNDKYDDSAAEAVSKLVAKGWIINGTVVTECPTLSINNEVFSNTISVSPNPVTSLLTINGPAGFELKSASVYSIMGKQVLSTTSTSIDTNNLPSGLYILKIENTEGQIAIKKIVKQ